MKIDPFRRDYVEKMGNLSGVERAITELQDVVEHCSYHTHKAGETCERCWPYATMIDILETQLRKDRQQVKREELSRPPYEISLLPSVAAETRAITGAEVRV